MSPNPGLSFVFLPLGLSDLLIAVSLASLIVISPNGTTRHVLFAAAWLLVLPFLAVLLVDLMPVDWNPGMSTAMSQIGSALWVIGFAMIFYSWAREDAPAHGKTRGMALCFALAWPFSFPLSHPAYLLLTRGIRRGLLAVLKLVIVAVAAGVLFLALAPLLGALLP